MATVEECEGALQRLAEALRGPKGARARSQVTDRTVSCHLKDLGVTFTGRLCDGDLRDISREPAPPAQIRLSMTSDDLLALTNGEGKLLPMWTSGRVKIEASIFDLMKLRKLL
jgi:hypothetical protein